MRIGVDEERVKERDRRYRKYMGLKMSKSNMIKYCRDEWIVIPAEVMGRLRGKKKSTNLRVLDFL